MNRLLPKQPRLRLDPESYEQLRLEVLRRVVGDANPVERDRIWKFTTRNSEVAAEVIPRRI